MTRNKISLPWPPKELNPNCKKTKNKSGKTVSLHWSKKAPITKKYRQDCYYLTKQAAVELPTTEKIHLFVDFYKPDRRHRDQDGMESSMKAGYDGIADALGVNDSRFVIHPFVRDEIVKGGKVIIEIIGNPE
jgi:crossover junction endodeoxyribonuclease RusA